MLWALEFPGEKNMVLKSAKVNLRKSVTRMAKRGIDIRTDWISRQFLYGLST